VTPAQTLRERAESALRLRRPLLLELDLTVGVLPAPPRAPVGRALARGRLVLPELVARLARAAEDPRVRGIVVKPGARSLGLAAVQEVREALLGFRAADKPAVAWTESFAEFGPGTAAYYLATACDEIWIQPSGDVGLTGVAVEATFLRDALDKAGVRIELGRRHEYKNAADQLIERRFTDAHREAVARLAASASEQIVAAIAAARGLAAPAVRDLIDRAPLAAAEALEARLVDRVGYRDEAYASARRRAGEQAELLLVQRYPVLGPRERLADARPRRRQVALIEAVGPIGVGRSRRGALGQTVGSDTLASALRAAARDDSVRTIVLRVESPGGSYVGSDAIWREVVLARRAGTPVVVSMGDLAASGGYFIAMAADAIVAHPATLTGSIGVLGGKWVGDGLFARLGLGHDSVAEGEHARMFSSRRDFTPDERALLERFLDRVYDDFTGKVAQGRGLSREHVHEVARGRVWTGADARERGLVDELGGMERAAALARERAGLPADAPLRPYPQVSLAGRLRPPRSSEDKRAAAQAMVESWGSLAGLAERAGLPAAGPLALPVRLRLSA
jgi:protease-4